MLTNQADLYQQQTTWNRLLPRIKTHFSADIKKDKTLWAVYFARLETFFPPLFQRYYYLYGGLYDFYYHLEDLLISITSAWKERSPALKSLDQDRLTNPDWFQSHHMLGGVCYVDLFAGDLTGIREKIPYFKELGLTYLHLMPLYKVPEGENDGGYAVTSYHADELLFLANIGVEVLRLDAVAFTWKRLGSNCENLPEAHFLIQAFNAIVQIVAPAKLIKSEAIVHPDEVVKYIHLFKTKTCGN
jgi:hypothetical protein